MKRQNWENYFMDITFKVAERATCKRAKVGSILVKDHYILTTGYNGSLPGEDHCIDVGCLIIDSHCQRCLHAEESAIVQSAKRGINIDGATCYCTHHPCVRCLRLLIASGISCIYYSTEYRKEDIPEEFLKIIPIIKS